MAEIFNPPHPGGLVKEAMEDLGLSINAFAKKLKVSPATIQRIVTEKSAISPEMALRLSATIGSSARLWLQLQADYDLWHVRERIEACELHSLRQ